MQEYTSNITFKDVNRTVAHGMRPAPKPYYLFMGFLMLVIGWGIFSWIYQVKTGMGVAGINHPVGWGTYITNFVFWVGIAHSGTLISAILFLVRSDWRDAVSRSTEAMTVFAVMTAGLFPLIHLGRLWVFFYILPYPNQRALYPNFSSPLVLDLIAVLTYLTVSVIFFYVGMIPDAASLRDYYRNKLGINHWRTKFYTFISRGWSGALSQWRHYNRSYLYFAMLATPLVISVHSVVSWDFAVSLLPGWHSTLFPPYFVAGAIHSGLAMALTLIIPMRKFINLKKLITVKHLEAIAKFTILTGSILAYAYIIEPFIENYTGSTVHRQFTWWRMTGWLGWAYYVVLFCNIVVPLSFLWKKLRVNVKYLFVASLLINVGMWLERYFIVVTSTAHDFMPHNWGQYHPTWVEIGITAGTAAFFLFFYMGFAKFLPTIPVADFKDYLLKGRLPEPGKIKPKNKLETPPREAGKLEKLFVFPTAASLIKAVQVLRERNITVLETFSPVKLPEVESMLGVKKSPVTYWTTAGGIFGMISGFALTAGCVSIYDLIVGGKPVLSLVPFVIVMFELTVLFASIFNLVAVFYYSRLRKKHTDPWYDERFSMNKFGLLVAYSEKNGEEIQHLAEVFMREEDENEN